MSHPFDIPLGAAMYALGFGLTCGVSRYEVLAFREVLQAIHNGANIRPNVRAYTITPFSRLIKIYMATAIVANFLAPSLWTYVACGALWGLCFALRDSYYRYLLDDKDWFFARPWWYYLVMTIVTTVVHGPIGFFSIAITYFARRNFLHETFSEPKESM